jgi:predicted ATPase/DNA-binding SARP family transcriptional activator
MSIWRIELFGGQRVLGEGCEITHFPRMSTRLVLAYLALRLGPPISRAAAWQALWPDKEPKDAMQYLKDGLYELRKILGVSATTDGAVIMADRQQMRLDPAVCAVDVREFEGALAAGDRASSEAIRAGHLTHAVSLYTGPLLPDLSDMWVFDCRRELSERYLGAVYWLRDYSEQQGDRHGAISFARLAYSAEPSHEETYEELIRLLIASGRPSEARELYHDLSRSLEEYGETPSVSAKKMIDELSDERLHLAEAPDPAPLSAPIPLARTRGGAATVNLPAPLDRFFGREGEQAELATLLMAPGTRLVTLTGPGGSGKTRLAKETARRLVSQFPGGAWFVPLADLEDPRLIGDKLLEALCLPRSPEVEPTEQIVSVLETRPSHLLLLDNFDLLIDGGAETVQSLLKRVPALTCLVTSRRLLGLGGERNYLVEPLPMPVSEGQGSATRLPAADPWARATVPSVALFVDRAQAARAKFALTPEDQTAVEELCRRLEGVPLALELAAARMATMAPVALLDRLHPPFRDLHSRRRDVPDRHRSLWATLAWSYDLLPPDLQRFFPQLSVFRGGWTVAAAKKVCMEVQADEFLEQLQACSMVSVEPNGEEPRYRMLETLREFGGDRLTARQQAELRRRHAKFFVALAEKAAPNLCFATHKVGMQRLEMDHDNLRAALDWSTETCAAKGGNEALEIGLTLVFALGEFWEIAGYIAEGRRRIARLLDLAPVTTRTQLFARALRTGAVLATCQSDMNAAGELATKALAIYRELGAPVGASQSLRTLSYIACRGSDYPSAAALMDEGLSLCGESLDEQELGFALQSSALVANQRGDLQGAKPILEQSLAIHKKLGNQRGIAICLHDLGEILRRSGRLEDGWALLQESLATWRKLELRMGVSLALISLGLIDKMRGEFEQARDRFSESATISEQLGWKQLTATALHDLGLVAQEQGQLGEARHFLEQALQIYQDMETKADIAAILKDLGDLCSAEGDLAAGHEHVTKAVAISREVGNRWAEASSLQVLAQLDRRQGDLSRAEAHLRESLSIFDKMQHAWGTLACILEFAHIAVATGCFPRATRLFAASAALHEARGFSLPAPTLEAIEQCRTTIGDDEFDFACTEGGAMSVRQAVDCALQQQALESLS